MKRKPKITIVGSINMDMVTVTNVFPEQGETLVGESFVTVPGGKGANQAVAAARLDAEVRMIGRVGDDSFGTVLKHSLQSEGIFSDSVEPVTDCSSGVATIIISDDNNRIVVTPGANYHVSPDYIKKYKEILLTSDIVLIQLEIPMETVEYVTDVCSENEIPIICNPAPAQTIQPFYLDKLTYLTPNETESETLFGKFVPDALRNKVIVTKGDKGAIYYEEDTPFTVPGYRVKPVDTTGAGDTFNGALAVALAEGKLIPEAIEFANAAAALSVTSFGAQGGMPIRKEVHNFLDEQEEKS
ncbi:ribokinase [Salipaludibacillus sp. HK11]|uniref:ribokinase n=1 Tax=Salipaludibacillus sp. HK11 TaxID=3394320 RepID=UPI0039FDCD48